MAHQQESISIKILGTVIIPIASLILIAINNAKTNSLKKQTLQITQDIENLKLSQDESKFKQDLEFKYIELFYQEIVSQDSQRQNQALQLVKIFNIETADKLIIWARETGLLQESVQQEAEQTNQELFQQRKPELLYSINKYLTNYKIAIHFKSNQGEPSFNKYNSCAKEIKQKLIELGDLLL